MPTSIMDIVDVIAVRHAHMAAALTMPMRMVIMLDMAGVLSVLCHGCHQWIPPSVCSFPGGDPGQECRLRGRPYGTRGAPRHS
ncbi:hypothetical protein [Actinoallomurus spadix]|nr:hypothetical protein [Actinoallomurus spadix]